MTARPPSRRVVAGYLVGVVALSTLVLGLLSWLYLTRVPEFTDALVRDPGAAIRDDPAAVLAVLVSFVTVFLLVGLIVAFGARYGPGVDDDRERGSSKESPATDEE
jgi:hypothetical protein